MSSKVCIFIEERLGPAALRVGAAAGIAALVTLAAWGLHSPLARAQSPAEALRPPPQAVGGPPLPHNCPAPAARRLRRAPGGASFEGPERPHARPVQITVETRLAAAVFDVFAGERGAMQVVLASDRGDICELIQHGVAADQALAEGILAVRSAAEAKGTLVLPGPASDAAGSPDKQRLRRLLTAGDTAATPDVTAVRGGRPVPASRPAGDASNRSKLVGARACPGLAAYLRGWAAAPDGRPG